MAEAIITSILSEFDQKPLFFEGWSWFKFNDFGLELGMTMKIYGVAKGLKLRVRKVLGIFPNIVEVTGKKLA